MRTTYGHRFEVSKVSKCKSTQININETIFSCIYGLFIKYPYFLACDPRLGPNTPKSIPRCQEYATKVFRGSTCLKTARVGGNDTGYVDMAPARVHHTRIFKIKSETSKGELPSTPRTHQQASQQIQACVRPRRARTQRELHKQDIKISPLT
jgi:hypothetical protein